MITCTSRRDRSILLRLMAVLIAGTACADRVPELVVIGSDFQGGARERFGDLKFGQKVNYVYAAPTGPSSTMECRLSAMSTSGPLFLHVRGRDDDGKKQCQIRITLGDAEIFNGPSGFSSSTWQHRKFPLPEGAAASATTCTISNIETKGSIGKPPWFMVAAVAIGPEDTDLRRPISEDFYVELPAEKQPFPQPLPEGVKPGFAWRGTKGWLWLPQQYLQTIPHLPKCGMNFLMNCYGSMCDIENYPWGNPKCNRWYEPLPAAKKKAYEEVVKAAQEAGLTFCFSMNPNLTSSKFVHPDNAADMDALWQHYAWMQGLGVRWFNISLDDISQGIDPSAQSRVVNEILRRLREKDPEVQMIFCPTPYWGDGTDAMAKPYLEVVARELDPAVYLFWTGDGVVGDITRKAADSYKSVAKHRLFLWDNYPVNDGKPTMHLGPVLHRDKTLGEAVDGYMANPLHSQTEANLIPMYTCGDYAWNPAAYDPGRSIGQAILHLAEKPEERQVLKELVERYKGMLVHRIIDTGYNSVRDTYGKLVVMPHSRYLGELYLRDLQGFSERFDQVFPNRYEAAKRSIRQDIQWIKGDLWNRYANSNLR